MIYSSCKLWLEVKCHRTFIWDGELQRYIQLQPQRVQSYRSRKLSQFRCDRPTAQGENQVLMCVLAYGCASANIVRVSATPQDDVLKGSTHYIYYVLNYANFLSSIKGLQQIAQFIVTYRYCWRNCAAKPSRRRPIITVLYLHVEKQSVGPRHLDATIARDKFSPEWSDGKSSVIWTKLKIASGAVMLS